MLELIQFPRALGVMNASPFCMKVEVFLKLAGLPYTVNDRLPPMRLPKGKLPALRDGDTLVCDSQAIVEHLQQRHAGQMPAALRQPLAGADHALRRMVEEHLYFAVLWQRWITDGGFAATAPAYFGQLPWPLRALVPKLVRRKIRRDLAGQGLGRHVAAEIVAQANADLDAMQLQLAGRAYFGGDAPGALDATAYAFLANLLFVDIDSPMRSHLQSMAPLQAYTTRMASTVGR